MDRNAAGHRAPRQRWRRAPETTSRPRTSSANGTAMWPSRSRRALGIAQPRAVRMLEIERIEREAPRNQPEARPGGAIAEGPANVLALERRPAQHVRRQIRIGQHRAAEADKVGSPFANVMLRHVRQPFLQI